MSFPHVAIVGGGITGLMLAIGLRARGVSCTVYERAAGISETGAGIGLSPNAEVAMQLIDPAVHAAFKAAVTPNGEDYFQWVDGYATDKLIYRLHLGKDGFQGGRRSEILQSWAKMLPNSGSVIQFGKELMGLDDKEGGPATLSFSDGTTAAADAVVGCDGVWSRVRSLVFGDAYRATYSHQYCFRAVVPMETARAAIGDHRASTRFMYNGHGAHSITYPVAKGAMLNLLVVIGDPEPWVGSGTANIENGLVSADNDTANRQTTGKGNRADAEHAFRDWQACAKGVVSLLPEQPDRWAIFDMLANPVPSYTKGRTVLAGDAAHASGPHLGAGAGFGIEDALLLATLLADVAKGAADSASLHSALQAYSDVRYERTQWLIQASRDAADLFQWRDEAKGKDAEVFGREITWRFHTIWNYDLEGMLSEARKLARS